ncbi:hypothetical protein BLA60_29855 [Actinophytocola xinjiangensis]|uniref:Uncharacterized protein n=1 Tax=Actinophytocola xinjiangensis TaxID=485602 RepID=A0A7Z0WGL8_9PSEU|nr:hypothetical protein [Actinophytocola xinjiangensis]OLF06766.1 hypothetical protein BLA60_29855 [Actinophytocola xinjiangensis]
MTVTFGRIGQVFLLMAVVLAAAALACLAVLDAPVRGVATPVVAGAGLILGAQGLVWTVVQRQMFGSLAALRRAAGEPLRTATVLAVRGTSSQIGAEAVARLDLVIDGRPVRRYVRVPFNHAATVHPGRELPVRTDGTRALIVEWDLLP